MSSSVKDLPDPLADTGAAVSSASADDMIAQMADEAIDQLIADAEKDKPPVSAELASNPMPAAPRWVDPLPPADAADTAASPNDAPAALAKADVSLAAVLDQVPATPLHAPAAVEAASAAEADVPSSPAAPMPETRADVRALLDDASHVRTSLSSSSPLLKPLVWLNAPFAGMPAWLRDALGQIGVVTTINAVAVLLYVLIFRR